MGDVAAYIRGQRQDRGWSQAHLAELSGVSRQWLVDLERGRHDRAELGKVLKLFDALGVDLRAGGAPATRANNDEFDLNDVLEGLRQPAGSDAPR
ncbi:MAG: helix-turn-helix domain-containing protein [Jatrophihabitantaceae bacterium]